MRHDDIDQASISAEGGSRPLDLDLVGWAVPGVKRHDEENGPKGSSYVIDHALTVHYHWGDSR